MLAKYFKREIGDIAAIAQNRELVAAFDDGVAAHAVVARVDTVAENFFGAAMMQDALNIFVGRVVDQRTVRGNQLQQLNKRFFDVIEVAVDIRVIEFHRSQNHVLGLVVDELRHFKQYVTAEAKIR